ncbi:MAG: molybdenum cofactor cytidylyltransferase [Anaerolineales bacterium]
MNLAHALRLPLTSEEKMPAIAFVGAGGKTKAMFQLARELPPPVILTTTTHLGAWQTSLADAHTLAQTPDELKNFVPRGVTLVTGSIAGERALGLSDETLTWLREFCQNSNLPLLIEADGARQLPLKAPAAHEPAIPAFVDLVIQVAGLSGLGKPLKEAAFRPEQFAQLSGTTSETPVTPDALTRVLNHPDGGLKNIPTRARRAALLNQADSPNLQAAAQSIAQKLLPAYQAALTTSLKDELVHAVREPIAGIVLAAGEATRFGQPKQLLDWRGEPFVRKVARTALQAGLWPVVVVTGAFAADVESALAGLSLTVRHNPHWQAGQASSIRTGLEAIASSTGGVIFLLADQPQIMPTLLQSLTEEHARTLAPVIAPLVIDRRGNPVLFDRVTFPDLMALEGDVGGRGVFLKHRIRYLPWHDDALLLDVDTPEDYAHLKEALA